MTLREAFEWVGVRDMRENVDMSDLTDHLVHVDIWLSGWIAERVCFTYCAFGDQWTITAQRQDAR